MNRKLTKEEMKRANKLMISLATRKKVKTLIRLAKIFKNTLPTAGRDQG